jgi:acyl carrier protein
MESAEIVARITPIVREVFDDESIVVDRQLTAADVDGWDSLNHIRLIVSVERAFGLKFTALETGKLKNVGEFVDLIQSKL